MDGIPIHEEHVTSLEHVAENVLGLRIAFVNVFAVTYNDGSWTLIDAGLPFTADQIRRWMPTFTDQPPDAIALTHGHFDHVSAARELADEWKVAVYAHRLEFPYLTGEKEYPPPNVGAMGGAMSLLSPLYPRGPIDLSDRLCEYSDTSFSPMPGWTVIHTPGHTPGHVSFFREADRCLIVGDAFCTTKPESFFDAAITQQPELHGPPAYFTSDWNAARESVQRLAEMEPAIVAPGHGQPLRGESVASQLHMLVKKFDEIAIPENRKDEAA